MVSSIAVRGRPLAALLLASLPPLLTGCANYRVGAETLYAPDVRTVSVPMIESESLRRDLGERLTEAVVREIEQKTPYKVVNDPGADSVLSVRVLGDSRRLLVEDPFDQPRVLENQIAVEVSWLNRRRNPMAAPQTLAMPEALVGASQSNSWIPAAGQTVASSQQQAIERLAQQIVGSMEEPW